MRSLYAFSMIDPVFLLDCYFIWRDFWSYWS